MNCYTIHTVDQEDMARYFSDHKINVLSLTFLTQR